MLSRSTSTDLAFRTLSNDLHHVETNPHAAKDVINVPVVSAVAMALFCDFLLLTLCIPILPELFKDTQFAGFETGLVFASKPFFQFFANPIMGSYVEVHGPRAPLLMGVLILSISTIVFAFGTSLTSDVEWSFAVVMIARSTQGLASASIMSAGMTLCAMTHNEQIRGSAMGLAFTGVALGTLLGPPIGGILGYYVYLWFPFALVSIVLLIVYVVMRILFRDFKNGSDYPASELSKSLLDSCPSHSELPVAVEHADATHGVLKLLKEPIILYVGCLAVLGNMTIGLIEPLVPPWLDDEFDQSILWQGIIFGCASLSYLIFTPIAGVLSDMLPKRYCLFIGFSACGLGLISFSWADQIPYACCSLALVGAGLGFVDTPILPLLAVIVEMRQQPGAVSQVLNVVDSSAESKTGVNPHSGELGYIYALNDMFLCIGFTLGPLLGSGIAAAFGGGTVGFKSTTLIFGCVIAFMALSPIVILAHTEKNSSPAEKLADEGNELLI